MRFLTDSDVSEWLERHQIPEAPYEKGATQAFSLQFNAPTQHRHLDALVRCYAEQILPDSVMLVHLTDWGLYKPSEMIAVAGIRAVYGENRPLIETPGHLIEPGNVEVAVSLFALSASFAWSAYLYAPCDRTTLMNWEGDLFDFWTDCPQRLSAMRQLLVDFDLSETGQVD